MYRTTNPDVAHREAGRLFARHRLRVETPGSFDAQANGPTSVASVNYVTWGSDVEVDRGPNSGYGTAVSSAGATIRQTPGPVPSTCVTACCSDRSR